MRYSKLRGQRLYQFALQKLKSCNKMPRKLKKRLGKVPVASFYISYQLGESILPYLCGGK